MIKELNPIRSYLFALLCMLNCQSACADVIEFGAATLCDTKKAIFELSAVTQHNDEFSIVTQPMDGLHVLPPGTHNLKCRLDGKLVQLPVRVYRADNGECMGAGYVETGKLSAGSMHYLPKGLLIGLAQAVAKCLSSSISTSENTSFGCGGAPRRNGTGNMVT